MNLPSAPKPLRTWEQDDTSKRLYHHLARGDWQRDFSGCQPGEVPWEAFRWDDWVKFLA